MHAWNINICKTLSNLYFRKRAEFSGARKRNTSFNKWQEEDIKTFTGNKVIMHEPVTSGLALLMFLYISEHLFTWSHFCLPWVHECPPWCSVVGSTVTMHQTVKSINLLEYNNMPKCVREILCHQWQHIQCEITFTCISIKIKVRRSLTLASFKRASQWSKYANYEVSVTYGSKVVVKVKDEWRTNKRYVAFVLWLHVGNTFLASRDVCLGS